MKDIIVRIKNNTANDFDIQELVRSFAENAETVTLGEEIMFKEYIRKGANQLGIDLKDIQDVYNSYRKKLDS
jgi:hypothetical protein